VLTPHSLLCSHCHAPLCQGRTFRDYFFCEFAYCSLACLEAAHAERLCALRSEEYKIEPHTASHWKVQDGNGTVVCITVGKAGAEEVLRRLARRKPPPFRPETGTAATKNRADTLAPIVESILHQKPLKKAA
jgi:hypothetical protein